MPMLLVNLRTEQKTASKSIEIFCTFFIVISPAIGEDATRRCYMYIHDAGRQDRLTRYFLDRRMHYDSLAINNAIKKLACRRGGGGAANGSSWRGRRCGRGL